MNRNEPIAVVGAGPAGLCAADTLRQLGYTDVVVFEGDRRVGGKVCSVASPAGIVEMGAVLASAECDLVLGLARRLGIETAAYPVPQHYLDEQGRRHDAAGFLASRYDGPTIGRAVAAYAVALERCAVLNDSDLAALGDDLHLPFERYAALHGFTPVAELARGALVGFGYGYYESVPAYYYMKLIGWLLRPDGQGGLGPGEFFMFPHGFQGLWEALARELDVRLETPVTALQRAPDGTVRITAGGTRHTFAAAIVAAPLHTVASFMALTETERALFGQLRSHRYVVSAFAATGLATGEFLFLHENEVAARCGHMNAWANRNPALPMYLGWQLAPRTAAPEALTALLADDIARQGGRLERVALRREWDYFPHVDGSALQARFFERVAALQGEGQVWYVGGALHFETVEHSARQARALVRRGFGGGAHA
ncbi:flavin monoamine oxidase family protein [Pseudoduganella chitinolytica]|uniref:Tryptophan 2-monooxygenase n=1 Tax=Pseudoduganella chitinolytica TaxID=34070 RepID=A0ABY8BFC3_9BURK|nr:FAD-dependent oxidoreductase [Pseudoduganella chitinolytica]WEF34621.1 FAD-dependent oxidoreductase [Pseudoduganella chitinolytica]